MRARLLTGLLLGLACGAGWAQTYPAKPVRIIVPYPPGGGTDTIARPLAQKLTESFGQQVIIDNRGGAGGNVGMELAARAAPDGYTLVIGLTAQLAVNPALYRKIPYDPVKDYEPITLIGAGAYLLVVHPSLPVKNVQELIALAKARPGQIAYASSGNGSGGHLCMELFKTMTGTNFVHIPYKGGGPALVDVLAGQVQVLFTPPVSATQHVQSGRLRALAVSTVRRSAGMPDLPTIAESGVPGYDSGVWYGVLAPAGTPREIVMRVNAEVAKVLQQPDFRAMLVANSIDPIGSSPEVLAQFIRIEMAKWAKVVRDADVRVD
jgi:tripartite-type tricarboxylate transporter receptor subunit TctC